MLDAQTCMNELAQRLRAAFGGRLIYLGLQGSYARGEADGQSDLDVMCVLEGLSTADLDAYGRIIRELPWAEKACGFICGREELAAWNPLEIACLLRSTRDWVGSLEALVPENTVVPPGSLVVGVPGRVVRPVSAEQAQSIRENAAAYLRLAALHK